MPISDHVEHEKRLAPGGKADIAARLRRGVVLDVESSTNSSLLSPIVNHFSSFSGLNLKGLLPTSPTKQSGAVLKHPVEDSKAVWQEGDLGDGRGVVPLLLVTSHANALQIFTLAPSALPQDDNAPETFAAPKEVFVIPNVSYDDDVKKLALPGVDSSLQKQTAREIVTSVSLLQGQKVALTTFTPRRKTLGLLALVIVNLKTGKGETKVELGVGTTAQVYSSPRTIAVAVSHPTPSIHLLDPITLTLQSSITDLLANRLTHLPVVALSGRLLAYIVSKPPHSFRSDDMGTFVDSSSITALNATSSTSCPRHGRLSEASQGALFSSAAKVGGGVARNVWAGIKHGARAASAATRSTHERLARSAPDDTAFSSGRDMESNGEIESRSLEEESVFEESLAPGSAEEEVQGDDWVKIVDLFPKKGPIKTDLASSASRPACEQTYTVIAHFRLPSTKTLPIETSHQHGTHLQRVSFLSFSPSGTHILVAPVDGRSFHILEIHSAGSMQASVQGAVKGQVWHLYELKRGHTAATVTSVAWDKMGRWVGVGTGKGTVHVFSINPNGGPPSAFTHVCNSFRNPSQFYPLSTTLYPVARFRPGRVSSENFSPEKSSHPNFENVFHSGTALAFLCFRSDSSSKRTFMQDIGIHRPDTGVLDLARLSIYKRRQNLGSNAEEQNNDTSSQGPGSALSHMMRIKPFGEQSDLAVDGTIGICWMLPGAAEEALKLSDTSSLSKAMKKKNNSAEMGYIAHVEICTHHSSPRILPRSIYLSRQIDFFSAQPIDDYTPLSMLDVEARTRKLIFRYEVEAKSPLNKLNESFSEKTSVSFNEPLLSALHDIIESTPERQIPGLPNGYNRSGRWPAIPIRSVKAGLNEGVDRVRREYIRAQHLREQRKLTKYNSQSQKDQANLRFENDTVLAPDDGTTNATQPSALPPSAFISVSSTSSATAPTRGALPIKMVSTDGEIDGDSSWGESWEEEYQKAVEDDGGPEDLVLGLMDEEEEERRKWSRKVWAAKEGYQI
ncbi:hypothetical protein L204_100505 [Cryptococcus depauperatus]|nr:hypothetical protein L204_01565 [Cryptococcus depauperatus CBS 7855]